MTYSYDSLNRLTGVMRGVLEEDRFSYDAVGNRLTDIQQRDYTYNYGNQLLSYGAGVGQGFSLAYDANGNLIEKVNNTTGETTTYSYDSENRLVQINTQPVTGNPQLVTYSYDPFGRRIEKTVNGVITRYVYDREDILFELDGNNNVVTEYLHGPGIDEPIAMIRGGQTYYYHADGLGSIIAITDSAGQVVQRYEYDSFGNISYQLDSNFKQPYTYTGREYDEESGLYYYRARYYDAKVGRFVQQDPVQGFLRFPQTQNRYTYVANNPVNWIDPWGLKIIYNKPPPYTVPPTGKALDALNCLDECLGGGDLLVTGGSETSGHSDGSSHYEGKACDIAGEKYNNLPDDTTTKNCAKKCGFTHGQYEDYSGDDKDHWHFQIGPNLGVPEL